LRLDGANRWAQAAPGHGQRIDRFAFHQLSKEFAMNKDQVEGRATQAKGDIKEAAGKLLGNQKLQGEGLVDQAKGKTQAVYGDAKEQVRKGIDRI
jgi:uncharacterized protein YjbJ (UPF0337 family)